MKQFIGTFNEHQLRMREDKAAIERGIKETGLKFIESEMIKKSGKIVAIKVYLTDQQN